MLNDEAHHCYQDKLLEHPDDDADKEDKERNRDARVWFRGLVDLRRKAGIKAVYDLSATPYYLKGSGYNEGFIFPWVGQRLLADGRDRVGDREGPAHPRRRRRRREQSSSTCDLWDNIDPPLPKKKSSQGRRPRPAGLGAARDVLEGALRSLYRSYEQNHAALRGRARRARRAAAGDDRRLPEHDRLEAGVRLDRRPRGRAARRHAPARRRATCRC